MIVTVTPNASIDKTYIIEDFGVDRINRPTEAWSCPGGKGVNVARVFKELGRHAVATGFAGGSVRLLIAAGLDAEGIRHDFVELEDDSRLCVKVMDPRNSTQTEINEPGPAVSEPKVQELANKIKALSRDNDVLVLCGNCPPGVPETFYADVIRAAKASGVRTVLDTSGAYLAEGVKAAPFLVKPNVSELSQLAGTELYTLEEITRAAKSMKQFGVSITAVTMGRSGALVTDGVQTWQAAPPEIKFASAVGSGDAFLAAFLDSMLRGEALSDSLVWATAAGAANATTYSAGFLSKDSIMEIRQGVTLTKIE